MEQTGRLSWGLLRGRGGEGRGGERGGRGGKGGGGKGEWGGGGDGSLVRLTMQVNMYLTNRKQLRWM